MNCRTDAYAGTDLPYSEAQLTGLDGTPGNAVVGGCSTFPATPFAPDAATNTVGSTVVYPAAGLAAMAKSSRARVVEINIAETGLSGGIDEFLQGPSGQLLPQLMA